MVNKIIDSIKTQWKVVAYIAVLALVVIGLSMLNNSLGSDETETKEVKLEQSPITIKAILPKGELYVCSSIIEDYESVQKTERHIGIIPENHSCVQIIRQKCSYKINLDKLKYSQGEGNVVYVKLPKLEYEASTQDTPFLCDNDAYWAKEIPNTNKLKSKVEKKIREQFETAENKSKAQIYAEEAVRELLKKIGYKAEFVTTLRKKKEVVEE